MGVREKVIEGFETFLADAEESANFVKMKGSAELADLIRNDPAFTDAFIEGSKKFDSQMFGKLPTEEGITEFVNKLDELADANGQSYTSLTDAYRNDPEHVIEILKKSDIHEFKNIFESEKNTTIAREAGPTKNTENTTSHTIHNDKSPSNAADGYSSIDHGLKVSPAFTLNETFSAHARAEQPASLNKDIVQSKPSHNLSDLTA